MRKYCYNNFSRICNAQTRETKKAAVQDWEVYSLEYMDISEVFNGEKRPTCHHLGCRALRKVKRSNGRNHTLPRPHHCLRAAWSEHNNLPQSHTAQRINMTKRSGISNAEQLKMSFTPSWKSSVVLKDRTIERRHKQYAHLQPNK